MKILVTGGTGRLGRVVVRQLLARGHSLRLLVRSAAKAKLLFGRIGKKLEFAEADLENASDASVKKLSGACRGVQTLVHLAAQVDYDVSSAQMYKANFGATVRLLEACKGAKVGRFVFCSSTSLYHKPSQRPIGESHALSPSNAYGKSKLAAETAVRASGIPFVILRPTLIYGPGFDTGFGAVVRLIRKNRMAVVGGGENRIALLHVEDAARAFVAAIEAGKRAEGEAFIISGEPVSQMDCYLGVARALGVQPPKIHVPKRALLAAAGAAEAFAKLFGKKAFLRSEYVNTLGEDRVFSTRKAQRLLGWAPKVKFADAVKTVGAWF
ncbi:MAG: NAD-dependent epimerase/dehydratase family protein [Candidatus Micrarchaeia archaeon]